MRNRIFITLLILTLTAGVVSVKAQMNDVNEAIERGNGFFHRGQYELAIFEYKGALNWPGVHQARARFNIGVCRHRLGLPREAVTEYRAAIKLSQGQYPPASYALGIALRDLRRYEEAREAFAQAVKSSGGKHAEALFELALESQRAGDDRAAMSGAFRYDDAHFDDGEKTFLKRIGPWKPHGIVGIMLEHPVVAEFLCRKLYRHFVSESEEPSTELSTARAMISQVEPAASRPSSTKATADVTSACTAASRANAIP